MRSDNSLGSADTRKKVLTNNNYLYHKYMEYIKLPNCSTKKPDRILAALRTEKGRRLFAIVAREINKRGFSLNQDNRLHEYFV